MISSLSKYFYKMDEQNKSDEITECRRAQRASNLDSIKTNNFLRKLRKIDSSENILNFVQLTEYKRTPKSKTRPMRKKQSHIKCELEERKDKPNSSIEIKETDSSARQKSLSNLQNDPTKISRKEKGENINILMKIYDERTISYESVAGEINLAKKPATCNESVAGEMNIVMKPPTSYELVAGEMNIVMKPPSSNELVNIAMKPSTYFDTFTTKSMIEVMPCETSEVPQLLEESSETQETNSSYDNITPCPSEIQVISEGHCPVSSKSSKAELQTTTSSQIDFDISLPNSSEIDLETTKSSIKLFLESKPQRDYANLHQPIEVFKTPEMIPNEFENDVINQSSILLHSEFPKYGITESSSRKSLKVCGHQLNQTEFESVSVEKFLNKINLQADMMDCDIKETAVLFTRKACSNESISSRFNFENSKIPIPCRVDHVTHPIQTKHTETLDLKEQVGFQDRDKPTIEIMSSIETEIENISKNSVDPSILPRENKIMKNISKNLMPVFQNIPTPLHELNAQDSSISKKLDSQIRVDFATSSRKMLSESKSNVQAHQKSTRISSNIKSKLSIFASGINTDRGQRSTLLVNPKRKLNKHKEIASRIPLNSGTYSHKNKSFASLIVRRQNDDNLQSKYFSQTSRRDFTRSFIKPETYNSQGTIKMKSTTSKKLPLNVEISKDSKTHVPKKISVVSNTMDTLNKSKREESIFYDEVNRCKDLEKEIMEKIEIYWQSIQKVCTIKNELIPTVDNVSFKNIMNQCFLNDRAIHMMSKLNEVERNKLREQCLSATDMYGKNEIRTLKEELQKYHEYVQGKLCEVAVKQFECNLEMTTTDVVENTKKEIELKNQEMSETVFRALSFVSAENEILTQYYQEIIRKNDECNRKLTEKITWLERENENLSTQLFSLNKRSVSSKTRDDVGLKRKDDQISEILKMYNDIEMKNNYHAKLLGNFMKSIKMIEKKIEHHIKHLELKVEKTKSQMEIAEMKRTTLDETIEQLKQRLEHNQREYDELMSKVDGFRGVVCKLRNKNKALSEELFKYKYPVNLEKNIQKMISLRNMLVNIVHNNDSSNLQLHDKQLLNIMRSMHSNDALYPMLDSSNSCAESTHEMNSKSTISNEKLQGKPTSTVEKRTVFSTENSSIIKDHGESLSNEILVHDFSSVGSYCTIE